MMLRRALTGLPLIAATVCGAAELSGGEAMFAHRIGEAAALVELCPGLDINGQTITLYVGIAGLSSGPEIKEAMKRSYLASRPGFASLTKEEACALAAQRYGRAGTIMPGLLK